MRRDALRALIQGSLFTLLAVVPLAAQGTTTRTFTLHRLTREEAAELLTPYVDRAVGGVYTAGTGVRAVTIIGTRETMATVDSILRVNDRPARSLQVKFQLIGVTEASAGRDPRLADVDASLRSLFQGKSFALYSEGATLVAEGQHFSLYLTDKDGKRFAVSGEINGGGGSGPTANSGTLNVRLVEPAGTASGSVATILFSTEVSVEFGKTTVLGSSVPSTPGTVLVLVVRPDLP